MNSERQPRDPIEEHPLYDRHRVGDVGDVVDAEVVVQGSRSGKPWLLWTARSSGLVEKGGSKKYDSCTKYTEFFSRRGQVQL